MTPHVVYFISIPKERGSKLPPRSNYQNYQFDNFTSVKLKTLFTNLDRMISPNQTDSVKIISLTRG